MAMGAEPAASSVSTAPKIASKTDWAKAELDLIFCALPHATTQKVLKDVMAKAPSTKVVDLSADFRLRDLAVYEEWYGLAHTAPRLLPNAVYGLPEVYRQQIRGADLVANPGCYPTSVLLALYPLWGLLQQFIVQAFVAGNLARAPRPIGSTWLVTILTASLFCLAHVHDWELG